MRKVLAATVGAVMLTAAYAVYRISAQDTKNCLQVGDSLSAFQVVDVTGPNKGKQLCYV
jgi:hypothetical protein